MDFHRNKLVYAFFFVVTYFISTCSWWSCTVQRQAMTRSSSRPLPCHRLLNFGRGCSRGERRPIIGERRCRPVARKQHRVQLDSPVDDARGKEGGELGEHLTPVPPDGRQRDARRRNARRPPRLSSCFPPPAARRHPVPTRAQARSGAVATPTTGQTRLVTVVCIRA